MGDLGRAGLLGVLVLVFSLQLMALHGQSLTGDGAHHLLAGHQALRFGQNVLNLEHPPLAKLVFALPASLNGDALAPPLRVEEALSWVRRVHQQPLLLGRATLAGRYMALAFFVLPFLAACFAVGRRHGGLVAACLLTAMVSLSLSALPYLTILQTDTAVALAFLLSVLAAERYLEQPTLLRAAVLALAAGFGLVCKFSAVLLAPMVLATVFLAPRPGLRGASWRRPLVHLLVMGFVVWAVVDAVYLLANRSYSSTIGRETISSYCKGQGTVVADERLADWESRLLTIERFDPYLAQWLTGFQAIRNQNAIGVYASYAFGEVRSSGRWWYFPAVFLVKTPLVILLVGLWGLCFALKRRPEIAFQRSSLPWLITLGVYLAVAFTSNYNLGVRHLLPVLPLMYLPFAKFLATRQRLGILVVVALAVESLALAPLWMSATNTWWLGENNPTRFSLGAGNLEYRQNFLQLARVVENADLEDLKVLYPTLAPEVLAAWVPGARLVQPGDELESGWYAVNVTVEQLVPSLIAAPLGAVYDGEALRREARRWELLWQEVARGEDHGYVAGTYHLYFL
jgi:hypothetical protein